MKTDPLRGLDEPSAALRILLELSRIPQGINVTNLYEAMMAQGVGRSAVDSSRRALMVAGLTEENRMKGGNRMMTILSTTRLGDGVARKLLEIQEIMDGAPSNQR
jgi:DNA-binding transcriptional ArsR family regulator